MKQHLNTLFVTTQGAYVGKDGQSVVVRVDGESRLQLPMHNLGGIMCFGQVSCSPWLMEACAQNGITISFVSERGRFLAAVHGFSAGNVLLRREQYRRADDLEACLAIARNVVAAKIANSRRVLLRGARDYKDSPKQSELSTAAARLAACVPQARAASSLDLLRGIEGESAAIYFAAFNGLLTAQQDGFAMRKRTRRPPMDRMNALLSFLSRCWRMMRAARARASGSMPPLGSFIAIDPAALDWRSISWRSSGRFWRIVSRSIW
jgi:CRISP-associated protein Cas1